jgi:hypothetical protein
MLPRSQELLFQAVVKTGLIDEVILVNDGIMDGCTEVVSEVLSQVGVWPRNSIKLF